MILWINKPTSNVLPWFSFRFLPWVLDTTQIREQVLEVGAFPPPNCFWLWYLPWQQKWNSSRNWYQKWGLVVIEMKLEHATTSPVVHITVKDENPNPINVSSFLCILKWLSIVFLEEREILWSPWRSFIICIPPVICLSPHLLPSSVFSFLPPSFLPSALAIPASFAVLEHQGHPASGALHCYFLQQEYSSLRYLQDWLFHLFRVCPAASLMVNPV